MSLQVSRLPFVTALCCMLLVTLVLPGTVIRAQAATSAISGSIAPASVSAGSTVTLTNGSRRRSTVATTTVDGNGNYTFTGLATGYYRVTPKKSTVTFSPSSRTVRVSGANVSEVNFTASGGTTTWGISGTITPTTVGAGATVTLGGTASASTTADASGNYSFTGLTNGSYTVTPAENGFTFSPTNKSVSVSGANVSGTNFTASATSSGHSVALSWTASTSLSVSGYKVYRASVSGGPYTSLDSAPVTSTVFTDLNVATSSTYYYVVTAVDSAGSESGYSNQATATIPTP